MLPEGLLPKVPRNVEELHEYFHNHPIKTNKMELFMLNPDAANNTIIFSCQTNLRFLCKVEHIYVDGTFEHAPKIFLQLFTVHGLKIIIMCPWYIFFCSIKNQTLISKASPIYKKKLKKVASSFH